MEVEKEERRSTTGEDAVRRKHAPKRRWPDAGYRLGMTFAQTCQTRSTINAIRGERVAARKGGHHEGLERESVEEKPCEKLRFKIAVFCSRQRSTFPDKPTGNDAFLRNDAAFALASRIPPSRHLLRHENEKLREPRERKPRENRN